MIAINLIKSQALDTHRKAMQQINFTKNLEQDEGETMFFISEEAKETILNLWTLWTCFTLIWYQYEMTHYITLNVQLNLE